MYVCVCVCVCVCTHTHIYIYMYMCVNEGGINVYMCLCKYTVEETANFLVLVKFLVCKQNNDNHYLSSQVELAHCNHSLSIQRWNFESVNGRYKRFGALRHVDSNQCLSRRFFDLAKKHEEDEVIVEPCIEKAVKRHVR